MSHRIDVEKVYPGDAVGGRRGCDARLTGGCGYIVHAIALGEGGVSARGLGSQLVALANGGRYARARGVEEEAV